MFAVVKTGGKQYIVKEGTVLKIEKIDQPVGSSFCFDDVLFCNSDSGSSVSVNASVVDQCKGDKVIIFKKKRRTGYKRKRGHRQMITVVKIDGIVPK